MQPGTYAETRIGGPDLPPDLASGTWTSTTCGTCWASICTYGELASDVPEGFLYDGQLRPVAWLNGAGQVYARFVHGTRVNVPEYMTTASGTYRILTDHLGSPRLVVNTTTGAVAQRMDYDAFGQVLADTSPGFQPFGFAGGLWDRDTGLVRFGARDYEPGTGRWTGKDPIRFAGGLNLYAYADNDPVNWKDPTGLWTVQVGGTVNYTLPFGVSGSYSAGIAFDGHGNISAYYGGGGGPGIGAGASAGINVGASSADDVHDLGGWFVNGSAGGGWGPNITADAFYGKTDDGRGIVGGGLSIGPGLGVTSFVGPTYTWLYDLRRQPTPCK